MQKKRTFYIDENGTLDKVTDLSEVDHLEQITSQVLIPVALEKITRRKIMP